MTGTATFFIFLALWVAAGLTTAYWLARRGHRDPLWLLTAVVFGPILALVAGDRVERTPKVVSAHRYGESSPPGNWRVLVGLDGSPESKVALQTAQDLLGPRLGRLILAEVVDYDAAEIDWRGRIATARDRLAGARTQCGQPGVTCEVLAGPPAETLRRFAAEHDVDLIVIGRRGRGLSVRLLGSVAEDLVRRAPAPVLVSGVATPAGGTAPMAPSPEQGARR